MSDQRRSSFRRSMYKPPFFSNAGITNLFVRYLNELERHTSGLIRQPQLSATQFNQRSARNPLHEQEVSGLNRTSQTSPQTPNRGLRSPNPLAQSFSEHQLYEIPSNDTRRQSKNLDHRERRQNADYQHQATDSANAIGDEYRNFDAPFFRLFLFKC